MARRSVGQQGLSFGEILPPVAIYVARRVSVQAKGYEAITREKVIKINSSGFFDSTSDKEVKILSFEVKTPIYQEEKKDKSKTLNVKLIVP